MRMKLWVIGLLTALVLVATVGCGSSETKTVTETVTETTEAESAESGSEEGEASDVPTATTIPDGTWKKGRDYQPGEYRAPGGEGCYWEEASSPNQTLENGVSESNIVLVIESPYFKTEECGTWEKVN